ncbi:hypothetical protein GQ600_23449 [Phytophthora cactorum]|nr:hypothetical protein GQ600_23449 [Phytophthora cactorum]
MEKQGVGGESPDHPPLLTCRWALWVLKSAEIRCTTRRGGDLGDDKFALQFSAAQLKAKIAQAKLEAKLAADAELLAAKKGWWSDATRSGWTLCYKSKADTAGYARRLAAGELLATLDMEKARAEATGSFKTQQQALSLAQERVEKLDVQSVAHLQHRFASKDQLRAASVEHVQRELIVQHEQEMIALREELAIARSTEKMAQEQLQQLQKELKTLRDNEQQALASRENVVTHEHELQAKVAQLETEKAVLQSKAQQVQKADAQLRAKQKKEALQRDNKELGEIASDLMQMAERQHAETQAWNTPVATPGTTHDETNLPAERKKRLRLSLG